MKFVANPVENNLIVRLPGDLTYDVAKDLETDLLNVIEKEKKSIIFDFSSVQYLSLNVCISFSKIYQVALKYQVNFIAIKVNEILKSILLKLEFDNIFTFAEDIESAMKIKEKKQNSQTHENLDDSNKDMDVVSGGKFSEENNTVEKTEESLCEHWSKKGLFSGLRKKCGNCKFFESFGNGKGRCKR